jgi:serine O-acetyltransferase
MTGKKIKKNPLHLHELGKKLLRSYHNEKGINRIDFSNLPSQNHITDLLQEFFNILYPGYFSKHEIIEENLPYYVGEKLFTVKTGLTGQVNKALLFQCAEKDCGKCNCSENAAAIVNTLLNSLPELRKTLLLDVAAACDGDPAAKSHDEIIISYPAIYAITTHRLAHELYKKDVPLIPRIMSEHAHNKTGIDIHPGAVIGKHFFIDHGTGVVIGETTVIGKNVKIYQGVTLGAKSFTRDDKNKLVRDTKRHPTIEDNVTIYSGSTILGGDTVIGKNSVIGGNVWLTKSIPPNTTVMMTKKDIISRKKEPGDA